jgi:hypothetical protein
LCLRECVFPLQMARWLKKCIKFVLAKFFFFTNGNSQTLFFFIPHKKFSPLCIWHNLSKKGGIIDVLSIWLLLGALGGLDLSDLVFTVRYFNHKIRQKFRTKNQILESAENFGTKILIVYSSLIHKLSEMCRFPTSEKECNVRASKSSKISTHKKIDEKWDKITIEISLLTSKNVYSITKPLT